MRGAPFLSSLVRLVLGAAFVLVGWALGSSTAAQADDRGVLTSTASAVRLPAPGAPSPRATTSVTQVVEDAVEVVPTATSTVTTAVEDVVTTTPVAPVVDEPLSAATSSIETVVTAVSVDVVEPVVEAIATTGEALVPAMPAPAAPVEAVPLPVVPVALAGGVVLVPPGSLGAVRAEESERSSLAGAHDVAAGSQVAPLFGAVQRDAVGEPPAAPSDREPVVPWPAWDLGALSPTSSPSTSLSLSLAVLGMVVLLLRPELRCAAARSGRQVLAVGPSWDPGSRPG